MKKPVIGISVGRKYENYFNWISAGDEVDILKLDYTTNNADDAKKCDGVILSGGEDVHPRRYDKAGFVDQFKLDDLNEPRDEFELKVVNHVYRRDIPLLGICRGMQLANVFFGGTLMPDIQWFGRADHKKIEEGKDRRHPVWLVENTLLESVTGVKKGEVNSAHHQCVERLGDGLTVGAVSPDGIVEAAERKDKQGVAFMMLVQWHPERMSDQDNPLSHNIRKSFLEKCSQSGMIEVPAPACRSGRVGRDPADQGADFADLMQGSAQSACILLRDLRETNRELRPGLAKSETETPSL